MAAVTHTKLEMRHLHFSFFEKNIRVTTTASVTIAIFVTFNAKRGQNARLGSVAYSMFCFLEDCGGKSASMPQRNVLFAAVIQIFQ